MKTLDIKICGLTDGQNMTDLDAFAPDFLGMIFHEASKRNVDHTNFPATNAKKVGVFVDQELDFIWKKATEHKLDAIQLHGNESPELAKSLFDLGFLVFKCFSIDHKMENEKMQVFTQYCHRFLFDTKGDHPGGNGIKFNWRILEDYTLSTPFLLSGGISPNDVSEIKNIMHSAFIGIDINSKFEVVPGIKNTEQIKKFIDEIRSV